MTEIKSASDEELAQLAKGSSGSLSKEQPQPVPKPYMAFDAGEVQHESGLPGIKFDFNYGARVTVPQGEYRVKFIDRKSCLTVYDAEGKFVGLRSLVSAVAYLSPSLVVLGTSDRIGAGPGAIHLWDAAANKPRPLKKLDVR